MTRRLFLLAALTAAALYAEDFAGKVVAISDGDTIRVMHNGASERIRLWGIDCPEMKQPFGTRAKQFTGDLAFGQAVTVKAELLAMLNGHVADCPMKSRMDIVEDYIIAQKTKAADGKNWMDRLWPLIWSALGVVAYLVASPCMLRKC